MNKDNLKTTANSLGKANCRTRGVLFAFLILVLNLSLEGRAPAQNILAQVAVPSNDCCQVAVNVALNQIYVSGGYSGGQDVFVVNGKTFMGIDIGNGSTVSVDTKNHNYWAATVYDGSAILRRGSDNTKIVAVYTGDCPVNTAFDQKLRRVWVGAQCGGGNDPLFAVNADTFNIVAGPIGSGGVMGATVVNPATGRLYMTLWHNGGSKRVNPKTYAVTTNAFGSVEAVNPTTSELYAISGTTLQIINGKPDPEVITASIDLGYSPSYMAVNKKLGHIYIGNPDSSSIEVRDSTKGTLITSFPLGTGVVPQGISVDPTRGRLYVGASANSGNFLYAIEDMSTAAECLAAGTC
jgi:DNA-binding beta-propeller fold protein YncE